MRLAYQPIVYTMFCCMLFIMPLPLTAAYYPAYQATSETVSKLTILSTTEESLFSLLIRDFQTHYPNWDVDYKEMNSVLLYQQVIKNAKKKKTADLIISSAMDLQVRLVNDGFAQTHDTDKIAWLPSWAQWRKQAFGFTGEPAVMVYNRRYLASSIVPESRFDLIEQLRSKEHPFRGAIGTYNIATSGLGYLFASQDAQQTPTWSLLTEYFAKAEVKLYESTSAMLDAIARGDLLLAYNVLGSYALAAAQKNPDIQLLLPKDYTLVMSRVALVSRYAENAYGAHLFLDYLLSIYGQSLLAEKAHLYPLHPAVTGFSSYTALNEKMRHSGGLRQIKIGPALLTYQDQMKKRHFLKQWRLAGE